VVEKEEEERTGEVGERGLELEQKSTKVGLSKVHLLLLLLLSSLLFVAVVIVAAVGWVLQGRGGEIVPPFQVLQGLLPTVAWVPFLCVMRAGGRSPCTRAALAARSVRDPGSRGLGLGWWVLYGVVCVHMCVCVVVVEWEQGAEFWAWIEMKGVSKTNDHGGRGRLSST